MPPAPNKARSNKPPRGKYASKACEECRRRRAKCDGNRPCSRCNDRGLTCQFSSVEDGRKPAPKSYVLLLRERIVFLEGLLRQNGIDPNSGHPANEDVEQGDGEGQSDDLTNLGGLCSVFEGCLTLDDSLNFDQDGEMRFFGPTSGRLQFQSAGPEKEIIPGNSPKESQVPSNHEDISEDLQSSLVDLYFTWEQPWSPIVDESIFRSSMIHKKQYFSPLLFNCILAVGSRFSDDTSLRSDPDDPNTAGKIFLEKARTLLFNEIEKPSLTTIQSLHIMGMVYISMGSDAAGWLHTGMANRLALDMGLNIDPVAFKSTVALSSEEMDLRRRVYWTLYCHDKLAASYTGRICSFLDSQGAVSIPADPFLTALIGICRLLEKILISLWGPKPSLKLSQRPAFLRTCLLKLRSWFYDLPPTLRIDQPNNLPHAYILHMVYYTARILLAKRFLTQQPTNQTPEKDILSLARPICIESARAMCEVSQKYRQRFGSFRQSPITATHCTLSAALVFIEEMHQTDACVKHSSLDVCMEVLGELATSWSPACHIRKNLQRLYQQSIDGKSSDNAGNAEPQFDFNAEVMGSVSQWPGDLSWFGFPGQNIAFPEINGSELGIFDPMENIDLSMFDSVDYNLYDTLINDHS